MARDLRVMVIKLADRLHNMSTLADVPREQQIKVARETTQIYAPLAHRLGIWKIKWELEDLAFKYLEPEAYAEITEKVNRTRKEREDELAEAVDMIQRHLSKEGIEAHIQARPKHLWSIYQKMLREEVDFSEIYDLSAIRIIVNRVGECYHALGLVHDLWMPIPERFSDYIAKPKSNMYQSLHTKVIGPRGEPLEVQIRTWDMHRVADFGVAAHWQYKERLHGGDEFERKLSWLRQQLFDWQTDSKDAGRVPAQRDQRSIHRSGVCVHPSRGCYRSSRRARLRSISRIESTAMSGNKCVGAKVNGRIVPLTYKFSNGDIIEIISRSNSQPSRDWLSFVKTSHARNKIKAYYRKLNQGESVAKGREILERELERLGHDARLVKSEDLNHVARQLNLHSEEDLLAAIGYGHIAAATVAESAQAPDRAQGRCVRHRRPKRTGEKGLAVTLDGVKNLMITRAKCCAPLPGEHVIGYVSRGKGVVLHALSCPNVAVFQQHEPERLVEIDWMQSDAEKYAADMSIKAMDRVGLVERCHGGFFGGQAEHQQRAHQITAGQDGDNRPDRRCPRHTRPERCFHEAGEHVGRFGDRKSIGAQLRENQVGTE